MEEKFEGKGTISEIVTKQGKKGDFYKIKIDGRTYNAFDNSEAFNQLIDKKVKTGDVVGIAYTESQVGEYVCKNLLNFKSLGEVETKEAVQKSVQVQSSFEKKDSSIARMNSLTNAIGFFALNKEVVAFNLKELPAEVQAISEETLLRLANRFYEYIVGGKN